MVRALFYLFASFSSRNSYKAFSSFARLIFAWFTSSLSGAYLVVTSVNSSNDLCTLFLRASPSLLASPWLSPGYVLTQMQQRRSERLPCYNRMRVHWMLSIRLLLLLAVTSY